MVSDEERIAPIFSPPPDILELGSFYFAISHTDAVKPTFRTPPEALQQGEEGGPEDLQGSQGGSTAPPPAVVPLEAVLPPPTTVLSTA